MGSIHVSSRMVCSVVGLADSQCMRVKKNTKRYVEGIARNVDVYIDPWRVQSDVFVVVKSRDIQKKKKKQDSKHAFKVLQMRTINEKETRIKLLEGSY